ncbi:protein spaetzle 3 [Plodia interpunctella]|uniref:protein spaetzle 3 n=1 Tax=Plodia interpunctella TaxID=58824 RepID=UPI002367A225|nr:protein spaetzle 3 [Plodia interpunctella]XP_053610587.1 protein spaetzle 3 [Plodia interpunctella]XP_053610588.1 protein spaetzle 3 [Plodia interpunctella]
MALANFTLTSATAPPLLPTSSEPLHVDFGDLLYSPDQSEQPQPGHEPFAPPATQQKRSKLRKRAGSAYLPPPNQFTHYPHNDVPHNPYNGQLHTQVYQQNTRLDVQVENQRVEEVKRYDNTGQYYHDPSGDYDYEQRRLNDQNGHYNPGYADAPYPRATTPAPTSSRRFEGNSNQNVNNYNYLNTVNRPAPTAASPPQRPLNEAETKTGSGSNGQTPPERPRGFTKVETGNAGGKTQLHAVLDYDDDYYDDIPGPGSDAESPAITPLQGPILLRNGTVPVVPLTSYPTVANGTFYQIPILWTALSVALGYELQGQIIRGIPCVKRNYQLYCPTAGSAYPLDKIESFIDENKALIKRMYGTFTTPGGNRVRRAPGTPDLHHGDSFFRHVRQTNAPTPPDARAGNSTDRVDACESKTTITTPYWAMNSATKLRAIVNTMHFEQAIHQEICTKTTTGRCSGDCGCEQKYKWHRLLAYDPSNDCMGIFMDWFLFPSCCVCRCNP